MVSSEVIVLTEPNINAANIKSVIDDKLGASYALIYIASIQIVYT